VTHQNRQVSILQCRSREGSVALGHDGEHVVCDSTPSRGEFET